MTTTHCNDCGDVLAPAGGDWLYCRWCDTMSPPAGRGALPFDTQSLPEALVDAYLFVCHHSGNGADPRRFESRGVRVYSDDDAPGRDWTDANAVRTALELLFGWGAPYTNAHDDRLCLAAPCPACRHFAGDALREIEAIVASPAASPQMVASTFGLTPRLTGDFRLLDADGIQIGLSQFEREAQEEDERSWWLSFCDGSLPEGAQFLGACIVRAVTMKGAIRAAWDNNCNPGGEVMGRAIDLATAAKVAPQWIDRLLTKAEVALFDAEIGGRS